MLLWLLLIGGVFTLGLLFLAFSGPNAGKALKRRIVSVKERHGEMSGVIAQAQVRKMFGQNDSRLEGYASSLIPKPALLRKRLEMTGRNITLGRYAMVCAGIVVIVAALLTVRGAPIALSLLFGM